MSYPKFLGACCTLCCLLVLLAGCGTSDSALESEYTHTAETAFTSAPSAEPPTQEASDTAATQTSEKSALQPSIPAVSPTQPERVFESIPPDPAPPQDHPFLEEYEQAVVNLTNQARAQAGCSPLKVNTSLKATARLRARECAQQFSHTRPDGSAFDTAYPELGFRLAWGENIAMGQKTPAQVMDSWMNSAGHRANILNPDFEEIAVGCYTSNGRLYWVQNFVTIG